MDLPLTDDIIIAVSKLVDDALTTTRAPSHSDLSFSIKQANLEHADPTNHGQNVGKAKRIRAVLYWAIENDHSKGNKLVTIIISQLKAIGGFRDTSPNYIGEEAILNAINCFDTHGFILSKTGEINAKNLENLKGKELTEALLSFAKRAKKNSSDAALLSGTSKDMIESTAKHIIQEKFGSHPSNSNFPTLLGQAYAALNMATPMTPKVTNEPAIKNFERAIFEMAISINTIRNKEGTGHGRINITNLSQEDSHSIIESVGIIIEFLINRLQQSN